MTCSQYPLLPTTVVRDGGNLNTLVGECGPWRWENLIMSLHVVPRVRLPPRVKTLLFQKNLNLLISPQKYCAHPSRCSRLWVVDARVVEESTRVRKTTRRMKVMIRPPASISARKNKIGSTKDCSSAKSNRCGEVGCKMVRCPWQVCSVCRVIRRTSLPTPL